MKEAFLYIFFGVLTTAVNFITYIVADSVLNNTAVATIIAWLISVIFAFITNKIFVFESKAVSIKAVLVEALSFTSFRILSGFLDLFIMILGVDILFFDKMLVKIASNIIVIIVNYLASKLVIFRKR